MKTARSFLLITLAGSPVLKATDSFNSEFSHFAGNAAIASASSAGIARFAPKVKHPALAGFAISASESFLGEVAERATNAGKFSLLDAAVGTAGAAVGAYATDKWYIAPKLETRKKETTVSLMVSRKF